MRKNLDGKANRPKWLLQPLCASSSSRSTPYSARASRGNILKLLDREHGRYRPWRFRDDGRGARHSKINQAKRSTRQRNSKFTKIRVILLRPFVTGGSG